MRGAIDYRSPQARSNFSSKPGADGDGRPSQCHQVIVLPRLAGLAEIRRASAQQAMVNAIAFQVHQFAARRARATLDTLRAGRRAAPQHRTR